MRRRRETISYLATGIWLLLVAAGLGWLLAYEYRAGAVAPAPLRHPVAALENSPRPLLLVFLHPHCPCSRATADELAWIMDRCRDGARCEVHFVQPPGRSQDWVRGQLWRRVAAIPGVVVRCDFEGRRALRFGARTSGHTLVYDRQGALRFEGGVTASRGHRGGNWGRDRVVELLMRSGDLGGQEAGPASGEGAASSGPTRGSCCVFGCPLFSTPPAERPDDSTERS